MKKILVIDDEWNMRNLIKIYLTREKMKIDEAGDGTVGVDMASQSSYDLVILDIMMPDIDGWEVCYKIREFQNVPILMLTARTDITDRVRGLNLGADDYLTKPFAPEELVARVNALLRRHEIGQSSSTPYFIQGGLSVDSVSREVKVNEQLVEFTRKEFELFHLLVCQPNQVYTREILLNQIGSLDDFHDLRTVDTHVKNIREKLRKSGLPFNPIKTIWGVGYKFNKAEDRS
ncbi:response regulator transcription factor (plasmid) [Alkalihalobacillus hwajinpoensis]|uniref:response regulator transcription factor n=1 Tax=Guptibacillus hwajinpoensis TaxID=208199 RepID=UPI001883DEE0|nr:response regulator transcription factor [Pseudalkalibacillus hwajinpoensis]MBF0706560.1 response regulator transcription factor [Pseudalkalibacillus hwajinpoensis]